MEGYLTNAAPLTPLRLTDVIYHHQHIHGNMNSKLTPQISHSQLSVLGVQCSDEVVMVFNGTGWGWG